MSMLALARADWMAESAAIVGILLIGFGLWRGDSAAAAVISLSIIWDGWHNLRQVIGDLMDESPTEMGAKELEDLPKEIKKAAERLPWVGRAAVRLRKHGHLLSGEVFVVPRDGTADGDGDLVAASTRLGRAAEDGLAPVLPGGRPHRRPRRQLAAEGLSPGRHESGPELLIREGASYGQRDLYAGTGYSKYN
jgi:hypothetical protein